MLFDSKLFCRTTSLLGLVVAFAARHVIGATNDMLTADAFRIQMWYPSAALRAGLGYRDNVLLSHTNGQDSAFWMSAAEFMLFRLPSAGWQFHFFAEARDTRYFDAPSVDNEQVAFAGTQLSKELGAGWKTIGGLNYMFQNQVFDFSANYTNQASVGQIRGHTLSPRWGLRKTTGSFWIEGEMNAARQWLDEPLDSAWQYGPRAVAGIGWGRGSELTLAYAYSRLDYDDREQVDELGAVVTNTSLVFNSHAVELNLTHVWDEKRHWTTTTAVGYEAVADNGSGFFDYDMARAAQRVRYRDQNWDVWARLKLSHYAYPIQTVSASDLDLRRKTMFSLSVNVERRLSKHLRAHASYNWDRSFSNLDFDDYQASSIVAGLALTY